MNLFDAELQLDEDDPPGYHTAYLRTAPVLGGVQLALNVFELPPGQSVCPYHYESGEEEWIVVLSGRPTLRTAETERELEPGDVVACPPDGDETDTFANFSSETARVLAVSTPRFAESA